MERNIGEIFDYKEIKLEMIFVEMEENVNGNIKQKV